MIFRTIIMYDLNIIWQWSCFFVDDGMSVIYTWAVIGAGSLSDGILYQLQSTQIIAQHYPGKEMIHLPQPCLFTVFYRTQVRSLFALVTHSLTHWLTDSLTDSCLVNFIDVTQACEDANSKLVDVVYVADDDLVGNNLLQIWKLRFGQKANLLLRLWAQGLV